MANNENLGFEHRFAFQNVTGTAFSGASATRFEVVSSTVKKQGEILDGAGLLGTRTRREDRTRAGLVRVGGQLAFDVNPLMMDYFLPHIMGTTEATDTFAISDSLIAFDMLHDPFGTGALAIKYTELFVDKMSLRFAPGILRMTLDVIGKTVTTGQSYDAGALGSTAATCAPYVFYDTASGFSIQSATTEIVEGELVIDNMLDVQFRNSQTATSIRAQDRTVSLTASIPLTATTFAANFGDKAAVDATITITNGTVATVFTLNNYHVPDEGYEVNGKGEVVLKLTGMARGDSSSTFDINTTVTGGSL